MKMSRTTVFLSNFRLKTHIFRLKWPLLVRFGLNLGLNNLKFGQKAISDRINRVDRIDQKWLSGQILSCLDLN